MPGFATLFCVGILPGGGDVAVAKGFLENLRITSCLVEKVAAGVAQGVPVHTEEIGHGFYGSLGGTLSKTFFL